MSKNWIIIPDVHGRTFWRDAVRDRENENIIFLGDYLDPYPSEGITPEKAYRELLDIIDNKDAVRMKAYLTKIRNHVRE